MHVVITVQDCGLPVHIILHIQYTMYHQARQLSFCPFYTLRILPPSSVTPEFCRSYSSSRSWSHFPSRSRSCSPTTHSLQVHACFGLVQIMHVVIQFKIVVCLYISFYTYNSTTKRQLSFCPFYTALFYSILVWVHEPFPHCCAALCFL